MAFFYLSQTTHVNFNFIFKWTFTIVFTLSRMNGFPEYYFIHIYCSSFPYALGIFLFFFFLLISRVCLPYQYRFCSLFHSASKAPEADVLVCLLQCDTGSKSDTEFELTIILVQIWATNLCLLSNTSSGSRLCINSPF